MADDPNASIYRVPDDDVGADTLARFRFQAELASRIAMSMLSGSDVSSVLCELHEDYVITYNGEKPPCLVSVKHLEPAQPRWTISALCAQGGVAHLFDRWRATGKTATCLLQTNSGLRTGQTEAASLRDACVEGRPESIQEWAKRLLPHLPTDSDLEECSGFLAQLRIEDRLPNREHLRSHNLVQCVPSCLAALNLQPEWASTVYDIVVAEVEAASRNQPVDGEYELLSDFTVFDDALSPLLRAKAITVPRLQQSLAGLFVSSSVEIAMHNPSVDGAKTRLKVKLERAGVGPTGVRSAQNLRLNWLSHRDRWTPDLNLGADPFDETCADVLEHAREAEAAVRRPGDQYGSEMVDELRSILSAQDVQLPGGAGSDSRVLMGCAFELTDRCFIYWSDEFDVESELT